MDGMNWYRRDEIDALAEQARDRHAFRTAVLMTLGAIVLAFAFVLGASALGVIPAGEEFSSPPVATID
jgi:hypothetical protein